MAGVVGTLRLWACGLPLTHMHSHSLEGAAWLTAGPVKKASLFSGLNKLHSSCLSHGEVSGTFQTQSVCKAFSFQYDNCGCPPRHGAVWRLPF